MMFRKTLAGASGVASIGFLSIFQKVDATDSTPKTNSTSITDSAGYRRVVDIFRKK